MTRHIFTIAMRITARVDTRGNGSRVDDNRLCPEGAEVL